MSDILIKGMEMPKKCSECLLTKLSPTGESLICNYMLSKVSWDEKPFDCPLIELPPHGDLIDRDVARKSIRPWSPEDERNGCTFDTVKKLMHTMLDRAPTIIPAEKSE